LWGGASALIADPVLEAIERHRRAYEAFMEVWGQTNVSDLYDRANAEEGAAAELRRFRELETEEEEAFSSLLATRPALCSRQGRRRRPRQSPASSTSQIAA
jgi:type II secretory pathway predicted ATPase ExeA